MVKRKIRTSSQTRTVLEQGEADKVKEIPQERQEKKQEQIKMLKMQGGDQEACGEMGERKRALL